jgi:hypothetical protein
MTSKRLESDSLYQCCDLQQLDFRTTAELEDLKEVIGQPRAAESVKFGMSIRLLLQPVAIRTASIAALKT